MPSLSVNDAEPPGWLKALIDEVVFPAVQPLGIMGPLGYRYWTPEAPYSDFDGWAVAVYPVPYEVAGAGGYDGCKAVGGFVLDVGVLVQAMTDVKKVAWNSPTAYTEQLDGPSLEIHASYAGKQLRLRFYTIPPDDEPASHLVNLVTGTVKPV